MSNNYLGFLEQRAAQRRLTEKFSRPLLLLIHTATFVIVMTAIWAYGLTWRIWEFPLSWSMTVVLGLGWSIVLAVHALIHYRRSAADAKRRELAIEDEMRQFIEKNADQVDDDELFAMHSSLSRGLERSGRWSLALAVFAAVNVVNWIIATINMGTSWAFQLTLPAAVLLIGGVYAYQAWLQTRQTGRSTWFTRLPLRHMFIFCFGVVGLALLNGFRLINSGDAEALIKLWAIILTLQILFAEIVLPIFHWLKKLILRGQSAKRKPAVPLDLVLGDDGEVLDLVDQDAEQMQGRMV